MSLRDLVRRPSRITVMDDTDPERCIACYSTNTPLTVLTLPGYGDDLACVDVVACRERAQAQGIWKVYR